MKKASVSELKASASEYLTRVKAGEEVLVTERGKPIAKIIPIQRNETADSAKMAKLELEGLARRGTGKLSVGFWDAKCPNDRQGRGLSALLAEREEGR